ncbi:MAG: LysM peptidoglycan-binding domain-containing protein [Clostridia bacterium]|nr:LysM peptidoglycan-binding domain-containing protein [Clostridia bacterium]
MNKDRNFVFIDTETNEELVLPITPESYEIDHGVNVETVNLTELGDLNIPGKRYMMTIKISCVFPAQEYNFLNEGANLLPYFYVEKFEKWCDKNTILRFIITDTNINTTCIIGSIDFTENDGTNDVYATITVKQYRVLKTASTAKSANSKQTRQDTDSTPAAESYKIQSGDTLSSIARKMYGDSSLYTALAKYNGISNANLIYPGTVLKVPNKKELS